MLEREEDLTLRKDLLEALSSVEDANMRVVLLLLHRGLDSINNKLDRVLNDEAAIKRMVLNGGAETHSDEHHWQREFMVEWMELKPTLEMMKERRKNGGYCDYAKTSIKKEEIAADSKKKIGENVMSNILFGGFVIILAALAGRYLIP
jgi:hypothetical protein